MPYSQSIDLCLAEEIGQSGLGRAELDEALAAAGPALDSLKSSLGDGSLALLNLPSRTRDLDEGRAAVDALARGAEDIVLLGTGGSSLGAQALAGFAAGRPPSADPPRPRLHFADNLDPYSMDALLRDLDLKTTRFLVVSKSGGTPETMIQLLAVLDALKESGLDWNAEHHVLAISDPGAQDASALRRICGFHHIPVLDHDPGIGGRYSVLSNVGMLPAMLLGLDPLALRAGAGEVVQALAGAASPRDCPPVLAAALHAAFLSRRGLATTVFMPYADRLRVFSSWFVQLWAESLGKQGTGLTPIAAAGPVDQHSQLQLFLDGPADKFYTIVMLEVAGTGPRIDAAYINDPKVGYLAGKTVGDLVDCEQRATAQTLARRGRPVRVIRLGEMTERTLGALFMHFMLETIATGRILGLDPFDQPAVEEGKLLARDYLGQM
jgi:glucose-6-phosphate isomerase